MIKLWICLALAASISSDAYANSREQEDLYDDYYLNDMDQGILEPVSDILKTTLPDLLNLDSSKDVNDESAEIVNYEDEKKFEEELDQYVKNDFDPKADGNFDDYQFEDNRSEVELDSSNDSEGDDLIRPLSGVITDDAKEENEDQPIGLPTDLPKVYEDADKTILEETKSILNEDTINDFDSDKTSNENEVNDNNSKFFEETSKILEESYSNEKTDKDYNNGGEEFNSVSESDEDIFTKYFASSEVKDNDEDDDTVGKAYTDLISDFDKLHGVLKKFNDFDGNSNDGSEKNEEMESSNEYEEIEDADLDKIFQSYVDEENGEDDIVTSDEKLSDDVPPAPAKTHKVLPYIIDGLVASDVKESLLASTELPSVTTDKEINTNEASTLSQEQLTIVEENSLINEFIKEHQSAYDIKASDVKNAINIRLTRETPVEVTSPNYPFPYPTGKTVDWMFTGDGLGIELNITDFFINGHLGDYLIVKPGGVDESGSTGIIFTYQLRTERRYRFLDVDKMFVRFVANPGNQFMRGFKFSARMVAPRPGGLAEPEPEPEKGLPDPPATITVNLGGISLQSFLQIEEEFRHIIADMATMYINTHEINPGLNTTLESTQITSRALCFHNWPKFELCTEVRFGVPIVYDGEKNDTKEERLNEDDLWNMWTFYSQRDPFAVRLRLMGITEYQVPNDEGVLTLWLVVAGGVVVSAALLALALWRFSCFEDYSRMPIYSDTESIAEKRTLDLYPTPHQTLPPLYTETDYKWANDNFETDKVDMGFPNKSFLPEFEALGGSSGRDRNFSFSPRDVYDV